MGNEAATSSRQRSTEERLVEAAAFRFWEHGYEATSLAAICEAAEVNPGSLYYFFPAKQDLLVAVLDWYDRSIHEMLLGPAWEGVEDPFERVFALLDVYRANLVETGFRYGCPIGNMAIEMRDPPEAVRAGIDRNFAAWAGAIEECLEAALGDEVGAERTDGDRRADPHELALLVLTVMEGAVMQARTRRSPEPFDASVSHLREYLESLMPAVPDREGRA